MAYLVCSQCGGKALAVSTRCPRCQAPFPRVEDRTPPAPKSLRVPLLIAAGILAVVAGGYALWLTQNGKHVEPVAAPAAPAPRAVAQEPLADTAGAGVRAATDTSRGLAPAVSTAPATSPVPSAPAPVAPPNSAAPGDSVRWERAIVRSDVNLRKTAGRDGELLRVLRIDQPVELGAFQEGWRQVRVGTLIGWADPRNFEIVPRRR